MTLFGRTPRTRVTLLVASVLCFAWLVLPATTWSAPPDDEGERPASTPYAYGKDFLKRTATLAVQDSGRIKPFSTWAGFTLLQINGRRRVETHDGRNLDPVSWALETMLFPERAKKEPIFLIEDDQVLADMGLKVEDKGKRDRYSYEDLAPRLPVLMKKVRKLRDDLDRGVIRALNLTILQRHENQLASNVSKFEAMLHALDILRERVDVSAISAEAEWFEGRAEVPLVEAFGRVPDMLNEVAKRNEGLKEGDDIPPATESLTRTTAQILVTIEHKSTQGTTFAVLPAATTPEKMPRWLAPGNIGIAPHLDPSRWQRPEGWTSFKPMHDTVARQLGLLQAAVHARDDGAEFTKQFDAFREDVTRTADMRGEYDRVELEVGYYAFEPFYKSLLLFVLGFVLLALTWAWPGRRWIYSAAVASLVAGWLLTVAGITWRCLILQRPPVGTLYETIPFITAGCTLVCFVIERINRQRIAIVLAAVLGSLGMWLQMRYQVVDRKDTMQELQAVLRTNFWLSTHVTIVTMGYAAGLLAAALAHVHVLGRVFGFRQHDKTFYRNIARMIYGMICFGLLFSVVGTILGGIWANDSWGRFWGWDPKENGALIICLWELAILHARMGGYIRDHGMAMAGVFTAVVVAFSWWGVNVMGVGLHSYGFTEGVRTALYIFYFIELAVLVAGMVWWMMQRNMPPPSASSPPSSPPPIPPRA